MASFHDPDYVALPKTSLPSEETAARRTVAMQQWLNAKTDHDYIRALTRTLDAGQHRVLVAEQIERSEHRESWRAFRHRNGRSVVRSFRILPGERAQAVGWYNPPACLHVRTTPAGCGEIFRFQRNGGERW